MRPKTLVTDPRVVRLVLLTLAVLVVTVGPAAAEVPALEQVPEQCYNDQIWDFVKRMGGCPDVPGVYD